MNIKMFSKCMDNCHKIHILKKSYSKHTEKKVKIKTFNKEMYKYKHFKNSINYYYTLKICAKYIVLILMCIMNMINVCFESELRISPWSIKFKVHLTSFMILH